ncbi:polysaccharide biosynthesis protein [Gemmatimonadota bacterium]
MNTLRRFGFFVPDILLAGSCYVLAYAIRVPLSVVPEYYDAILRTLPVILVSAAIAFPATGLYRTLARYASITTLVSVFQAVTGAVLLSVLGVFLTTRMEGIPRSVFIIQAMLLFLAMGGVRILPRLWRYPFSLPLLTKAGERTPVLVYGAGDAGEAVVRDMLARGGVPYWPVGFVDDDPGKVGRTVHGRPVMGRGDDLERIIEKTGAQEILLAIPSARGPQLREILERCRAFPGVAVKSLPSLGDLVEGRVTVQEFHDIHIEDLLKRAPQDLDPARIRAYLEGKTVMVTGAGGSIGSELCRQIAGCAPKRLILFEQSEFNLYRMAMELEDHFPGVSVEPVLGDASHQASVEPVISRTKPYAIFHAAAYKHVPLVEMNPCEGVMNNVLGVVNTALSADRAGVHAFVFISTDKAVRPTNVMGAVKRVGELYVQLLSDRSETKYSVVRFGNVLGSSGSVIPRFTEQIREGGPVTVTDPEVSRYFMLTSEAVGLVMQAATLDRSGDIFVLDMGSPVQITDLARDLSHFMGYGGPDGQEIEIEYTGLRPGEKLHEELVIEPLEERPEGYESLLVEGYRSPVTWEKLEAGLQRLTEAARGGDVDETIRMLEELVPEYEPLTRPQGD